MCLRYRVVLPFLANIIPVIFFKLRYLEESPRLHQMQITNTGMLQISKGLPVDQTDHLQKTRVTFCEADEDEVELDSLEVDPQQVSVQQISIPSVS